MIRYCLHPKSPHKNINVRDSILSTGKDDVSGRTTYPMAGQAGQAGQGQSSEPWEEMVTCQFCKYLLAGALLGDCRVTKWIGSGTFGDVYEAEQLPPLNRRVAIKVMAAEHVSDEYAGDLFAREVQAIAALDHPNILPVLRVGVIAGRPYLVMKF